MKKLKIVSIIALVFFLQACNSGNSKDSVAAAKDANEKKDSEATTPPKGTVMPVSASPVDKADADFAVEAANGGVMEVDMGNYARENASDPRVKNFGAMMVADHSKANAELKKVAAEQNITLPDSMGNAAHKNMAALMKKKGKDFDKAYMDMMLSDHKKDVKAFEKAAKNCKNPAIKDFAATTLPVLMVHLDSSKAITGNK